jgi:hypothetical protein
VARREPPDAGLDSASCGGSWQHCVTRRPSVHVLRRTDRPAQLASVSATCWDSSSGQCA